MYEVMKSKFSQPRHFEKCRAHRWQAVWFGSLLAWATASGQELTYPLQPPDRSSPRAALKTFLDSGDALGTFLAKDYLPSPTRAEFHRLIALGDAAVRSLDLSEVPPVARVKTGRAAALALYSTLSRIPLPPFAEIPDAGQFTQAGGSNTTRWVIPHTEIALERVQKGPRSGEFLFSADTVANAGAFFERVRGLDYTRPVPLKNIAEIVTVNGGWMVPYRWIQALPAWFRNPVAGQAGWKWIGLICILGGVSLLLRVVYRLSRRGSIEQPFLQALRQSALPAFFLLATPVVAYLALAQLNMIGRAANAIELLATAVMYLAGAWIAWRSAPVVAEAIIASPTIAPESIDAHLIRICTRLLSMVGAAVLLGVGAERLGIPVYGIVASLGVGGLAIALAAQPTIENLIGGLNLFADRPLRVGDACRCGSEEGTVETIGMRSTRIRGSDRSLTTIPNGMLSKMSIVNFARRDRMLIKSVIGLRYETTPEQLNQVLAQIREMLLAHPRLQKESSGAWFAGFGASSLDVEVRAYAKTTDGAEFLSAREDVWLKVSEIVHQSGGGFAGK
jgi:MscS family membrane protein